MLDAAITPAQETYPWDRENDTFLSAVVPDPAPSPVVPLAPDPPNLPQVTLAGLPAGFSEGDVDGYLMLLGQESEPSGPNLGVPPLQDANQHSQVVPQNTVELIDLPPSGPSRGRLKRPVQNRIYIDNSIASSIFNESPAAKRVRTPTQNSPSSQSRTPSAAASTSQTPCTTPQLTRPSSPILPVEAPVSLNVKFNMKQFLDDLPDPSGSSSPTQVFGLDTLGYFVPVSDSENVRETTADISSLSSQPQAWPTEGATIILGKDSQNLLPNTTNETNRTYNTIQPPYDPLLPDVYDLPAIAESSFQNQLDIPSTSRGPAQPLEVNAGVGDQNQETNAEQNVANNPQRLPLPTSWPDAIRQAQLICQGGPSVNWAQDLHPRQVAACFTVYALEELDRAWELARTGFVEEQANYDSVMKISEIPRWTPRMFADIETKTYVRYFPAVVGTKSKRVYGFDLNCHLRAQPGTLPKDWITLPHLKFCQPRFDRVIAGSAGFLVVDGGEQPLPRQPVGSVENTVWQWQQAYKDYWILEDYRQSRGQTMLVIINPLTLEARLLPPMPHKILTEKVGSFNFYDAARVQYRLLVVGVHHVPITDMDRAAHPGPLPLRPRTEICLAVYCSRRNEWVHFDTIPDACPTIPRLGGRSGIAVMNHGVYYGGHKVVTKRDKQRDVQIPSLFYFNTSNDLRQRLSFTFDIASQFGLKVVEPPKLVRAGPDKIYALTREAKVGARQPTCLFITEVLLNLDGSPTGSYEAVENGKMPPEMFNKVFRMAEYAGTRNNAPDWNVVASEGLLAIKVERWDPDLALFHMETSQWILTSSPCPPSKGRKGDYRDWDLIEGTYEPIWLAIP